MKVAPSLPSDMDYFIDSEVIVRGIQKQLVKYK
jgi:hypothetical protein